MTLARNPRNVATSPLIQVDELAGLLAGSESDRADLTDRPVVLDVRYRMTGATGSREFERAHIPGASYVDMNTALATIRPDGVGGRHPMPTVETFTAAMRSAGVTMSRAIVAYDDWASLPASRLWWMLRYHGFTDVRVLDGGMAAWTAAGQPTRSGRHHPDIGDFSPSSPGIGRVMDAADAMTYAGRQRLLDARSADRFRGENETIDPVAGHIPGALSLPTLANVDAGGRFLPADQLASRFQQLKAANAGPVGTYCGSGVQATHLALALSVAGITDDADVYIGSWSDWVTLTDPARPIEV